MSAGRPHPRASLLARIAATLVVTVAAGCNTSEIPPSPPTGSASPAAVPSGPIASPGPASPDTAMSPGTSGAPRASTPVGAATPLPVPPELGGPAFTPPPAMEPVADETCLAIVERAEAQEALGQAVGDIEAQASDPSIQLTCAYRVGSGGSLLITISSESVETAYDAEIAIASGQGQTVEPVSGLGDRAFYAAASATAPQQIVFVKGPAIVRLWNQTDRAIGRADFVSLARTADGRIEAEVRPAP